jgi:hypothetical protein
MNIEESQSEVARLMQRIDMEYTAAQLALTGLALGTARHEFINARTEQIAVCRQELGAIVGDQESFNVLETVIAQADAALSLPMPDSAKGA